MMRGTTRKHWRVRRLASCAAPVVMTRIVPVGCVVAFWARSQRYSVLSVLREGKTIRTMRAKLSAATRPWGRRGVLLTTRMRMWPAWLISQL